MIAHFVAIAWSIIILHALDRGMWLVRYSLRFAVTRFVVTNLI
ncbi:hypothetical protein HMPREF1574_00472 [Gardnerella pickettii JCP7659]|uniref:Uncharacterized protein n=1 Tax=Gardnerella pickettii JCP7719 TaxID=1261061 RepID=S4H4Y3_9BIFI|nr:hypothetical protein HMPREF1576_00487 [Gardnerella pickettii JCP7719]EPI55541.1 hypothetical protein HMPREF1574_00472 [Gardnerella pickettii JCP7659]